MSGYESDFSGNTLSRTEELYFIYEGPTFNGKMELPSLVNQLKSTEIILEEIIKNLYIEKKFPDYEKLKLFIKLKRGSFQEIIEIILNHPLTIGIVGGCIVVLFQRLLEKKDKMQCNINIENMINNISIVKEIDNIVIPLKETNDKLIIYSPKKKEIKTEISFNEKDIIKQRIKKLEEEISIEIYEEEFFGQLYFINIERRTMGFSLEGTNKHVPISFIKEPSVEELRRILFEKLKIKANATYKNKELDKLDIIEYEIKKRKNLYDFNEKIKDKKDKNN